MVLFCGGVSARHRVCVLHASNYYYDDYYYDYYSYYYDYYVLHYY